MGRDSNFVCKTCKTTTYLGHMSYSFWCDFVKSLDEFYAKCKKNDKDRPGITHNNLYGNSNLEKCLKEHAGHEFFTFSYDWYFERDGRLYMENEVGDPYLVIENFDDYDFIDLDIDLGEKDG